MQQQHDIFSSFLGAGAAQPWENVDSILQTLEDQQSLLTGMFRDFVREASQHKAPPSGTSAAAAGPAATADCSTHTGACSGHHTQQQHVLEQRAHALKRSRATELPLNVTLEELYSGTVKRVPVQLRRQDACTGAPVTVVQQLQVCVQPGLHAGTRITLPGLGNLDAHGQQSDLTFIVQQQLHPAFRRLADDLYAIVNVPLVTALTGGPVELKTLNGQLLQLPVAENTIITPNSELVVHNQGMPVFGDETGKRGALHVRFRVCFPSSLSTQQQQMLRQALAGSDEQALVQCVPGVVAAAVATAVGLLPKPDAGLPLLPPSPTAAQQEGQDHKQQRQQRKQQQACPSWPTAAAASWRNADGGLAGSPGSADSAWTAAATATAGPGRVSAFARVAGAAACSFASSSSAAGLAASMQSTGSSREPLVFGQRR